MAVACNDALPTEFAGEQIAAGTDIVATASTGWQVGSVVPDLSAYDVNDALVPLSDFAGSFVLLEIGGAWCAPTQFMAPFLPTVEQTIRDDGTPFSTVVTLVQGIDATAATSGSALVDAWLTKYYGGSYRTVLHMNGSDVVAAPWYDPIQEHAAIPILFLLGPGGEVIQMQVGAMDEDQTVAWVRAGVALYFGPAIHSVTGVDGPVSIAVPLVIGGTYSDRDDDTHSGSIDWGDGSASALVVNADGTFESPGHTYAAAGFYNLTITLVDDAGHAATLGIHDVTVFDPDGGFIAGSGSVVSDGLCAPEVCGDGEGLGETARFTLLARYAKKAVVPDGALRFRFVSGSFSFESTAYDWLLVNQHDSNAQLKGVGMVNGMLADEFGYAGGTFRFMLRATDGLPDTFQLEIWLDHPDFGDTGAYVYLNQTPMVLESGNIIVNTGR